MKSGSGIATTKEAAELVKCCPTTIRRWVKQGDLKPLPGSGRRYFIFKKEDVEGLHVQVGRPRKDGK